MGWARLGAMSRVFLLRRFTYALREDASARLAFSLALASIAASLLSKQRASQRSGPIGTTIWNLSVVSIAASGRTRNVCRPTATYKRILRARRLLSAQVFS